MTDAHILAGFFLACSAITFVNVYAIHRDKTVKGVSTIPCWLFIATNLFEVYYFGRRGDTAAMIGSIAMFAGNFGWIAMVWFYRFEETFQRRLNATFAS
jgi:hypothetical protein